MACNTGLLMYEKASFRGGYKKFHKQIVGRMPPDQTPNYYIVGEKDAKFERQKPFTI
jgi:hypothetical protein